MANQTDRATIDLVINGQQSQTTLRDIATAATNARRELSKMVEANDPAAYRSRLQEYQTLAGAQASMQTRLQGSMLLFDKFKQNALSTMTGMVGGNLITAGLSQLVGLIPVVVDHAIKLKDSFADIQKNANMSAAEVEALNEKLYAMPTRTSTEDLRKMAAVGGQFGIGAKDMEAFVDGANKVSVALGDEFGGAEKSAEAVLKLRNVFKNFQTDEIDQDLLHIGNALNVLSAEGAATAPVMTDFASRMGGVLIPLGLTEGQVLGLSATLEELNVTAERGSTATVNIFQKMLTETETFAKVAGMKLKDYKDLIGRDMNGAFLAYVEGLKKAGGNQLEFMAILEKSRLTGAGEMEVLSKLATNTKLVGDRTNAATDSLKDADSAMGEYNTKNLQLAVSLKKLADLKEQLLTKMIPLAEWFVTLTTRVLGLSSATDGAVQAGREAVAAYESQRGAINGLVKDSAPLIKRYDELKAKTKLTADEQVELKKIVAELTKAIPTAATEFNSMGEAMGVNTLKAREYVKQQQAVLANLKQIAIQEQQTAIDRTKATKNLAEVELNSKKTRQYTGMGQYVDVDLAGSDIKKRQDFVKAQDAEIKKMEATKAALLAPAKPAKPVSPAPVVKAPLVNTDQGGDLGESKDEAKARKEQERAEKAAKKKGEKQAADTKQAQKEFEALLDQSRARIAKSEKDAFEAEQIEFGAHYAKLLELAGKDAAKQEQVRTVMYDELAAITEKDRLRQAEAKKKADEKAKKDKEEENKEHYETALNALDQQQADRDSKLTANPGRGEAEQQMMKLQADEAYLTAKLLLEQTFAQKSADTQRQLTENSTAQARLRAETEKAYAQQMKQAEYSLQDAKRGAMAQGVEALKGFLKQNTIAYKAAIVAQKAFAIADVIINRSREVAEIWANPTWSLLPDGGTALKGAYTAAANIRAGVSIAAIVASGVSELAQKDDGGFTSIQDLYGSASGFMGKPTRVNKGAGSYIVGEKRPEWIMGGEMLQNPVMAAHARMLQAMQETGSYKLLGSSALSGATGGSTGGGGAMPVDLSPLIMEMRQLGQRIDARDARPVRLSYRHLEEFTGDIQQARLQNKL